MLDDALKRSGQRYVRFGDQSSLACNRRPISSLVARWCLPIVGERTLKPNVARRGKHRSARAGTATILCHQRFVDGSPPSRYGRECSTAPDPHGRRNQGDHYDTANEDVSSGALIHPPQRVARFVSMQRRSQIRRHRLRTDNLETSRFPSAIRRSCRVRLPVYRNDHHQELFAAA